ncbi:MAG: tetratricopeptide repeat protein [Anaerolineaceae bacterium]|nr:tetratricopeptide repeat protein [Anaerolineaceae bacterium]
MRNNPLILILIIIIISITACSTSSEGFDLGDVPILGSLVQGTATITPQPYPTSTPTPIPAMRIDQAEWLLVINGDYDQAIHEFQIARQQTNDEDTRLLAELGIARTYFEKNDRETALILLRSLVDTYPNNPKRANAYYYLGRIYYSLGRYFESASSYDEFLRLRPSEIDSMIQDLKGDALVAGGDYIGAINAYLAAIQLPHLGNNDQLNAKLGNAYHLSGNPEIAIMIYQQVFDSTVNEYTKAQMDFLIGQIHYQLGDRLSAYEHFQHAVDNYPASYDTYSGLVTLVNDGQVVSELQRGLVDYYAGQYSLAVEALDRYLAGDPEDAGTALYFKGLALRAIGESGYPLFSMLRSEALYSSEGIPQDSQAIAVWKTLTEKYSSDTHWADAWDEIAYTQWAYQEDPASAATTMLAFVSQAPADEHAPGFLFFAGRYFERADLLADAAITWERMADMYPSHQDTFRALILSGIARYRLADFEDAERTFQRSLLLANSPSDQAAAYLWVGKCQKARGNPEAASQSWLQAATRDPTGYYSERARELSLDSPVFNPPAIIDMAFNLENEEAVAQDWLRLTFSIPADVSLDLPGELVYDQRYIRAKAFHSLGLFDLAKLEFSSLRGEIQDDPVRTYRFMKVLYNLGYYSQAIQSSRQILSLAHMNDLDTLSAPIYFNHIRFGLYYKDIVLPLALKTNLDPLLLYAMIRQESLFDGFAHSTAGARGLLQLMPATGAETAAYESWPVGYTEDDLNRPIVNLRLGASYLERQINYFNGNKYAGLAAYNAGAGNTAIWVSMAQDDPDLLLEIIRYQETRQYIQYIVENYGLYKRFYGRDQ